MPTTPMNSEEQQQLLPLDGFYTQEQLFAMRDKHLADRHMNVVPYGFAIYDNRTSRKEFSAMKLITGQYMVMAIDGLLPEQMYQKHADAARFAAYKPEPIKLRKQYVILELHTLPSVVNPRRWSWREELKLEDDEYAEATVFDISPMLDTLVRLTEDNVLIGEDAERKEGV